MITKEKFDAFMRIRDLGVINMNDYTRGAVLAGISEDDYCEIIVNFKEYYKHFKAMKIKIGEVCELRSNTEAEIHAGSNFCKLCKLYNGVYSTDKNYISCLKQ